MNKPPTSRDRLPLSRDRVIARAINLADQGGIDSLSMRKLARALDVEPMSLYHHVANKDDVLDGIVDAVFAEIDRPTVGSPWRPALRARALSARSVLRRHRWAAAIMESRINPGAETLGHHDAVLGTLREDGMTLEMAGHVYSLLDSYIYGFALQEANEPLSSADTLADTAEAILEDFPVDGYPHLAEFTVNHVLQPGYDFGREFEFGLDLILDGIEATMKS